MIINDLTKSFIELSSYSANIDDTITVTLKKTDFNDVPIKNINLKVFDIFIDGNVTLSNTSDKTANGSISQVHDNPTQNLRYNLGGYSKYAQAKFNANGECIFYCKLNSFGLITIAFNESVAQVMVKGWKRYKTDSVTGVYVDYNETHARCIIPEKSDITFTTGHEKYTNCSLLSDLWIRPFMPVVQWINHERTIMVRDNQSEVYIKAVTAQKGKIMGELQWTHRGVPE